MSDRIKLAAPARPRALAGRLPGRSRLPGVAFAVVCVAWGTTLFAIKAGLDAGLPPMWFAALRFLCAAAVLGLFLPVLAPASALGRGDWLRVLPLGAFAIAFNFALVFWAEQHISSGMAGLLVGTQPLATALLSRLTGGGVIGLRMAGALALGLGGVALLVGNVAAPGTAGLLGQIAILLGATIYGGGMIYTARRLAHLNGVRVAFAETLVGGALLAAFAAGTEGAPVLHWTTHAVLALAYLSVIGSGVGLVLSFWLIRRWGERRFSLYAYVTPAVAVLAGAVGLGEPVSWQLLVGGTLVLVALGVAFSDRSARPLHEIPELLEPTA